MVSETCDYQHVPLFLVGSSDVAIPIITARGLRASKAVTRPFLCAYASMTTKGMTTKVAATGGVVLQSPLILAP